MFMVRPFSFFVSFFASPRRFSTSIYLFWFWFVVSSVARTLDHGDSLSSALGGKMTTTKEYNCCVNVKKMARG